MGASDISLAMRVDDLTLLECVFSAEPIPREPVPQGRLVVASPDHRLSLDVRARRNVLRARVQVDYALAVPGGGEGADGGGVREVLRFGVVVGVVVTTPVLGDAAVSARHMAGAERDAAVERDRAMERSLRLEAIKAGHAFAQAKLAEMSALSPAGPVMLPLVDADQILLDIERGEVR